MTSGWCSPTNRPRITAALVAGSGMVNDQSSFREKAREFALKAQRAKSHQDWRSMTTVARSYVLLEANARWLESTDKFVDAVKNNQPWPAPDVSLALEARQQQQEQ